MSNKQLYMEKEFLVKTIKEEWKNKDEYKKA